MLESSKKTRISQFLFRASQIPVVGNVQQWRMCAGCKHLGKCVKVDVLSVILPRNIFQESARNKVPFCSSKHEVVSWKGNTSHLSPCSSAPATENKVARGNHGEQMLSTTASGVRVPGRLQVEQLLSWTCGNLFFFPSEWFLSLMLCPVQSSNSRILGNPEKSAAPPQSQQWLCATSAQTYFKTALEPPWSKLLSSNSYLAAKDHLWADSSCSSRYVIYARVKQNGRFHLNSDHWQGLPGTC